jgi:hypothetical protein
MRYVLEDMALYNDRYGKLYQTTRRHTPNDRNINICRREIIT